MKPELIQTGNAALFTRQIPFEQIGRWSENLGASLIHLGIPPAQAATLLETAVSARCSQCAQMIPGAELAQAARTGATSQKGGGRLGRLSMGYCASPGCSSRFLDLLFKGTEGVDWAALCDVAERRGVIEGNSPGQAGSPRGSIWRSLEARFGRMQIVTIVFIGMALILAIYWELRTPSWSQRSSVYRADPASSYRSLNLAQ
jgi:hypothetical protein